MWEWVLVLLWSKIKKNVQLPLPTSKKSTTKKKPTPRYTHETIKKKRAIVYYYVRIYTTANVSADTVEGDQQLYYYVKAVKPTGKTTLVQFLFFWQRCSTAHDLHHVHVFIFVEFTFLFGGGILVLLVLGDKTCSTRVQYPGTGYRTTLYCCDQKKASKYPVLHAPIV